MKNIRIVATQGNGTQHMIDTFIDDGHVRHINIADIAKWREMVAEMAEEAGVPVEWRWVGGCAKHKRNL